MEPRPRIDLDGVALTDADDPVSLIALFRHRTTEGLLLLMPESGELLVPWASVESVALDLMDGKLAITFEPKWAASQRWLRGTRKIVGSWLDRFTLTRTAATR